MDTARTAADLATVVPDEQVVCEEPRVDPERFAHMIRLIGVAPKDGPRRVAVSTSSQL
ncbi:hypothetical protein [Halostagnicola sp. A56]|uniref:hypothetical protein n=1 Tax=Halostagnicola sp. A56 TaxID=1495067 RepID=UPI0012E1B5D3|nr:hypothetical protein [Halostagnicola sp. A56]